MTRKQYIRRINELTVIMHREAKRKTPEGASWKLGQLLKYQRDHAKMAAERCGSYQKAWDDLKPLRELYGVK